MKYGYSTVKKDFEFLCDLDRGGDYQDIEAQVFELMALPTKDEARYMYLDAIRLWFVSIQIGRNVYTDVDKKHLNNKKVIAIGNKYGYLECKAGV